MAERILVINPNSSTSVTKGLDTALAGLRFSDGPIIDCVTLEGGPPGIESQRHVDGVVGPLCEKIQEVDDGVDAYVIACFSDPGLQSAREITKKPVFGISECSILAAITLGDKFGIIAILEASVTRHNRYIRQMGIDSRFAGDISIGVGVVDLDGIEVGNRMVEVGRQLIDEKKADVLIMGCAGMANYRPELEQRLGISVIDPTQAAVAHAVAAVRLGYRTIPRYTN